MEPVPTFLVMWLCFGPRKCPSRAQSLFSANQDARHIFNAAMRVVMKGCRSHPGFRRWKGAVINRALGDETVEVPIRGSPGPTICVDLMDQSLQTIFQSTTSYASLNVPVSQWCCSIIYMTCMDICRSVYRCLYQPWCNFQAWCPYKVDI